MSEFLLDLKSFFQRRGGARVFSRFRGRVYVTSKISITIQIVLLLSFACYLTVEKDRFSREVTYSFWHDPKFLSLGLGVLVCIMLLSWVTVPVLHSTFRPGRYRYVFHNETWLIRCVVLIAVGVATAILAIFAVPSLIPRLGGIGMGVWVVWLVGGVPTGGAPILRLGQSMIEFIQEKYSKRPKSTAQLILFPHLRPQNTRVINLDVGALAPRLNCVADTLRRWNRSAEERAPTSVTTWEFARSGRVNKLWRGEQWFSSWRGVEDLRERIADLLRVTAEKVVLVGSTTRALDVALESIRPSMVITTDGEHESEYRLLALMEAKYGTKKLVVPLRDAFDGGQWSGEAFITQVCTACERNRAPAIMMSQVCYANGWMLPIGELSKRLRTLNNPPAIIIDGAHAVGQTEVDLSLNSFDFYAFSGHKWLFGPPTLGILILGERIKSDRSEYQRLCEEAYEALAFRRGPTNEGTSSIALDPLVGLAAITGELTQLGIRHIWENITHLRNLFISQAERTSNVTIEQATGIHQVPGILNLQRKGRRLSYEELVSARNKLEETHFIVTKVVNYPSPSLRVCLPFYLQPGEIKEAVTGISDAFDQFPN